jgi:hypothetical protein
MFPKCREFHFRRADLVLFSFFGRLTAGIKGMNFCQAVSMTWPQVGSKDQNSSNLKGLGMKLEKIFVLRVRYWMVVRVVSRKVNKRVLKVKMDPRRRG